MTAEKLYLKPVSVDEAIQFAKKYNQSFRFLAGGTDVLVNKFQGTENADCLIDLTGIEELKSITIDGNHLKIGALIRLDDLKNNKIISDNFPALIEAAHAVASPMLRKTATLGGNILCENRCVFYNQTAWWRESAGYCLKYNGDICIATGGKNKCFAKFVSDTVPVLISVGAMLELVDSSGMNIIPLQEIFTGDGISPRNLQVGAIIKNIILPLDKKFRVSFNKLRPRETVDFSSLTSAVSIDGDGKIKIVLGGLDPMPLIFYAEKDCNIVDLIDIATKTAKIVDNDYYSRSYRKEMISHFLRKSFEDLK